jgi:hypothetical protein
MPLLAEYGFSEGSGTTTADSSGAGHTLTASGSPWTASGHTGSGVLGTSGSFSGQIAPNTSQTAWTIMCWIKLNSAPAAWSTLVVDSSTGSVFFEITGANGSMHVECAGIATASNLSTGIWYHVAISRTQAFVNGVASGSSGAGSAVNWGVNASFVVAGAAGGDDAFPGVIDDLRLFSDTQNAATVTTWMNTPVGAAAAAGLPDLVMAPLSYR